jgi:hypothetical protein
MTSNKEKKGLPEWEKNINNIIRNIDLIKSGVVDKMLIEENLKKNNIEKFGDKEF